MKSKFTRKFLIIGIALLLTLTAIGTGTYAWFSMNNKVETSGMELYSSAPTNMLISVDPTDALGWKNGVTNVAVSPRYYMPSSSINGIDFYAITSSEGINLEGGVISESNKSTVKLAKVERYDENNNYYAEFALYIKAGDEPNANENFSLSLDRLQVSTTEHDLQKTVRLSVSYVDPYGPEASTEANTGLVTINQDGTIKDSEDHVLVESTPVIYKFDSETALSPVESLSGGLTGTAELGSDIAIAAGTGAECFKVDYTGTYYTTIIVRIWFEGQHPDCLNEATDETVTVSLNWRVIED